MRQPSVVAIFAKTPGFTPAKSRLAHTIGATRAEAVHRFLVARSLRLAGALDDARIAVVIAPAEASPLAHAWWQARAVETIDTGEGHLGQRMQSVYARLLSRFHRCVLIGTDSPGLSVNRVEQAIAGLASHASIVGPSRDGGFYLFGGQDPLPEACWLQPVWGGTSVLNVFSECLREHFGATPHYLDPLSDLDRIDDLSDVLKDLATDTESSLELKRLLREPLAGATQRG